MIFSERVKGAEPYLKMKPITAAEKAEKARRLCYEIKAGLKRTGDGLRLYPAEWEGVSAEAHRQFCSEIIGESNESGEALDVLIEKLNAVILMYSKDDVGCTNGGLPSSIL